MIDPLLLLEPAVWLLPPTRGGNLVIWAVFGISLVVVQAVTLLLRPHTWSLDDLIETIHAARIGRLVLFAFWFWFGWHVFVRGGW